jgi:putative membrane protein
MSARRVLPLALIPVLAFGCRFFRPVDPNAPRPQEATAAAPAAPAAPSAAAPAGRAPATARPSVTWTDAGIAAMVLALNYTDISYARLAPARAERQDVKQFAERMLTDHTSVNLLVTQLLQKLDVVPEDNVASLDMRDESSATRDILRELNGRAFDSTYIASEVRYHRKFLTALDQELIPFARNGELKALLSNVRPAVAGHLAHAEQVHADVLAKR